MLDDYDLPGLAYDLPGQYSLWIVRDRKWYLQLTSSIVDCLTHRKWAQFYGYRCFIGHPDRHPSKYGARPS